VLYVLESATRLACLLLSTVRLIILLLIKFVWMIESSHLMGDKSGRWRRALQLDLENLLLVLFQALRLVDILHNAY
jgi:hypothetical protein